MIGIHIDDVSRQFGDFTALEQVQLQVRQGEFFSLLGPSGCGKTTLLNMIAGFLDPTTGRILIGDEDVTGLPPYRRGLGIVFQDYALFPHLTVFDNVAYGLQIRKQSKKDIKRRVEEVLALVQLASMGNRRPHQLSGGQRQRVAIARALAIEPSVLLLDEPLSNLDAKLRKEMQTELRSIQQRTGVTTILVTHDQEEALSLSDRTGILGDGKLQQVGTPLEVYRRPANRFVADFIGQVNLIQARKSLDSGRHIALDYETSAGVPLVLESASPTDYESNLYMVRPERIKISMTSGGSREANWAPGLISHVGYAGDQVRLKVHLEGKGELQVVASDLMFPSLPAPGDACELFWDAEDVIALPQEGV
ncbi:putative spermidine/putrescine transport system ATP-binding protein [Bacillus sp. OV322]|uniref:ABC transporter ATP-binding protein n=1 Tax=Bacillus sp. OV322 TaxID=1882764 RepID=UPI0008E7AA9E|nr:ABC transporter ATP-binding protein [Bacillus sp. OV322]SFC65585.1 putative spermidine/putrescine transport system ATP-binding protein [Bacillus sp. OV322]